MSKRVKRIKEQKNRARTRGQRASLIVLDDVCDIPTYEEMQQRVADYAKSLEAEIAFTTHGETDFHCPECNLCLMCFQRLRGKKMHNSPCNYGCGLDPSNDIYHKCGGDCHCKNGETSCHA